MNFEKGDLITLDGDKDYIVTDIIIYDNKRYTLLITVLKPLKIMLCEIKTEENNQKLVEIKDNDLARKIIENIKI